MQGLRSASTLLWAPEKAGVRQPILILSPFVWGPPRMQAPLVCLCLVAVWICNCKNNGFQTSQNQIVMLCCCIRMLDVSCLLLLWVVADTCARCVPAVQSLALMLTGSACMDVLGPLGGMVNVVYCGVMGIVFQSLKS